MLNIELAKLESMDCFEGLVCSVALWKERNYEMLFSETWGFSFQTNQPSQQSTIGNRISSGKILKWDHMENYHGMKFTTHMDKTAEEALDIIQNQLGLEFPVCIDLNLGHWCLVIGIDKDDLYCLDMFFNQYNGRFSITNFKKEFSGNYVILSVLQNEIPEIDWKLILKNVTDKLSTECVFKNIRSFADEMASSFDICEEVKGYENDIWQVPLFSQLQNIVSNRINFANALRYIAKKCNEEILYRIADSVEKAGVMWSTIRGMLVKSYFMPNLQALIPKISTKIYEVASFEESIAELVSALTVSNESKPISVSLINRAKENYQDFNEFVFIDLGTYVNNKGVDSHQNSNPNANFSGTGNFLYLESLPQERIWHVGCMKFCLEDLSKTKNDNVMCMGQVINVKAGYYKAIMLLGCSDFGDFSEKIIIQYSDKTEEELLLQFSRLTVAKPFFGEIVACECKFGNNNGINVISKVRLYVQVYPVNSDKVFESLRLPYAPMIHLFAISLGL